MNLGRVRDLANVKTSKCARFRTGNTTSNYAQLLSVDVVLEAERSTADNGENEHVTPEARNRKPKHPKLCSSIDAFVTVESNTSDKKPR